MGAIRNALANSMESDLKCTSRVYFDNVMLMSQKPCQHITSLIVVKLTIINNAINVVDVFSIKYRYSNILLKKT